MLFLTPSEVIDVRDEVAGQQIISITAGPANRITILSQPEPGKSAVPGRYRCTTVDSCSRHSFELYSDYGLSRLRWIHPLSHDRLLFSAARGSPKHPNGRIVLSNGRVERDIYLGDGISSLQVTTAGNIWIGYFDEGLFGNRGWLYPNGGVSIIALDEYGAIIHSSENFVLSGDFPSMTDTCMVNIVSSDEIWYFYEHRFRKRYPLIKIMNGMVQYLGDITQIGYYHIAVWNTRILAIKADVIPHEYHLFSLGPSREVRFKQSYALQTPSKHGVNSVYYTVRGPIIWMIEDGWIYGVDVRNVPLA